MLAREIEASKALEWLNQGILGRLKFNAEESPPSLHALRPCTFGQPICSVPEIARWYFGWGLDLRLQKRDKAAHALGFQKIEASLFMALGWYETYRIIPEDVVAELSGRGFVTLDICQGGCVIPVTAVQLKNMSDTFTVMPR